MKKIILVLVPILLIGYFAASGTLVSEKGSKMKFGLSEVERKQYYIEIVEAEDKANMEAEAMYPTNASHPDATVENVNKKIDMADSLADTYRATVREKYSISEEQASDISIEAYKNNWSLD